MKKKRCIVKHMCLLAVCLLTAALARATKNPVPVYLVAGQSNTDGRVPNSELPAYIQQAPYEHCYWSYGSGDHGGNGQFELFRPRIINKNMPGRWAYDAVTYYWLEKSLHRDFYVIKESLGGTAIDLRAPSTQKMYWSANSAFLDSTKAADKGGKSLLKAFTENIGACIDQQLSKCKEGYEIKAFIWHQGESDRKTAESYYDNMKAVIDYVRAYVVKKTGKKRYATLPVILGGISHRGRGYSQGVEQAQIKLTQTMKNVYFVPVPDATLRSDNIHFDATGAELLGKKIYNQLVDLRLAGKNARRAPLYLQTRFKGKTLTLDGVDATLYLAEKPDCQGRTVVLCPGGGYNHLAGAKEGADWVPFFHGLGISVAVVRYRLPEGDRNRTLGDVRKVFEQIHRHADEWGINPNGIGIMGFSAGGHLAAAYSNAQCDSLRPAFSILLYPVIKLDTKPHQGMAKKFLGDSLTQQSAAQWSADRMVSQETPPAFIAAADDDPTIDVLNGVAYYEALHRAHVPSVLHIYRDGGHGWGYKTSFPYHDQLLSELERWLWSVSVPAPHAVRVACVDNSITYGARLKYRNTESWPAQLQRIVGDGYNVRNYGVSGSTMSSGNCYMDKPQYDYAKRFMPQVVVIKLGTNDAQHRYWKGVSEYKTYYQRMVDELRALPSHPRIVLCYPSTSYRKEKIDPEILEGQIMPAIQALAKKNHLDLIDLHTPTKGHPELFPDQLHPNAEGSRILAETVADYLVP